jgi:hypothetical protein
MKISEMKEAVKNRENLTGFLHIYQIKLLNKLFDGYYNVSDKSYREIANKVVELYEAKKLSNKQASMIFTILMNENTNFKTESHRFKNGEIFEYSADNNCYIFLKKGSKKEFDKLNHYI